VFATVTAHTARRLPALGVPEMI